MLRSWFIEVDNCIAETVKYDRTVLRRVFDRALVPLTSDRADLWGDVESGALRLPIDRTFPLDQAAAALAHMRANAHFGKIVLTV